MTQKRDPLLDPRQRYYAQNKEGLGKKEGALNRLLNRGLKKYKSRVRVGFLADTFSGGFSGFRYGYPLALSNDSLVSKSAMVGIFTEVRGGPLEGLRWYWDFAPEVKEVNNGNKTSFTWSRPSLGWAISFQLLKTELLTFEMDITPKLGVMDLDASLLITDSLGDDTVAKFRVKNAESFGIDGGISWQTKWFLLRVWGASDLAGLLTLKDSAVSITSFRGGIDSYWDLFKMWDVFEFSLLTFGAAEKISIEREASDTTNNIGGGGTAINEVEYLTLFIGLGATIQW
jgi:hypothetical protein